MRYAVIYQDADGMLNVFTSNHITIRGAKVRLRDAWRTYGKTNCGIVEYDKDVCGYRDEKIIAAIKQGEAEWVTELQ